MTIVDPVLSQPDGHCLNDGTADEAVEGVMQHRLFGFPTTLLPGQREPKGKAVRTTVRAK